MHLNYTFASLKRHYKGRSKPKVVANMFALITNTLHLLVRHRLRNLEIEIRHECGANQNNFCILNNRQYLIKLK